MILKAPASAPTRSEAAHDTIMDLVRRELRNLEQSEVKRAPDELNEDNELSPSMPDIRLDLSVEDRLLASLEGGPLPWHWAIYAVQAPYTETYSAVTTLLRQRAIRLLPNNWIELIR